MQGIVSGRAAGSAGKTDGFGQGWVFNPDGTPADTWSPYITPSSGFFPAPMPARYEKLTGHGLRLRLSGQGARNHESRYNSLGQEFLALGPEGPRITALLEFAKAEGFVEVNVLGLTGIHAPSPNRWEAKLAPPVFPTYDRRTVTMSRRLSDRIREMGMVPTLYYGSVITPPSGGPLLPAFRYVTEENIEALLGSVIDWARVTAGFDGFWWDWLNQSGPILSDPPSSWGTLFGRGKKLNPLYPGDPYELPVRKQRDRMWWLNEWLVARAPGMRMVGEGHPQDPRVGCVMPSAGIVGTVGSTHPHRPPIDEIENRVASLDEYFCPGREARWFLTGRSLSYGIDWFPAQVRLAMRLSLERAFSGCMIDSNLIEPMLAGGGS